MKMIFGPDDEDAFFAAKEQLLTRFGRWRSTTQASASDADLALGWKFGYADGDLLAWSVDDLNEFLLEWVPRKVMMPATDVAPMIESLRRFFAFLAEEQLLSSRSSSLRAIDACITKAGPKLKTALADTSKFGVGKSLFSGMQGAFGQLNTEPSPFDDGVDDDLDDDDDDDDDPQFSAAEMTAMMEAFNNLPEEERRRILGGGPNMFTDPWRQLTDGVEMGPAELLQPDEIDCVVDHVPILQAIDVIRSFVGKERKLTEILNLTPADARELIGRLELIQPGEWIGGSDPERYLKKIRSAGDHSTLQFHLDWARRIGAIRVARGRMHTTASWDKHSRGEAATKAALHILEHGPLKVCNAHTRWQSDAIETVLDEGVSHILAVLWAVAGPFEYEDLYDVVEEICDMQIAWPPQASESIRSIQVRSGFDRLCRVLATAGLVRRSGAELEDRGYGILKFRGGDLELTSFGKAILGDYLTARGYSIPVVGVYSGAPLRFVFEHIGDWHVDHVTAEFNAWATHRSIDETVDEVIEIVNVATNPMWRIAAIGLVAGLADLPHVTRAQASPSSLSVVGPVSDEQREAAAADELARQLIRRLVPSRAGGHAVGWLVEDGTDPYGFEISHEAMLLAGIDLFFAQLGLIDDDETEAEFVETISQLDDVEGFVDQIWRLPDSHVGEVLDAFGRFHPDSKAAKAARKASFKHRSHVANQAR